jgi:hypothetical protein
MKLIWVGLANVSRATSSHEESKQVSLARWSSVPAKEVVGVEEAVLLARFNPKTIPRLLGAK